MYEGLSNDERKMAIKKIPIEDEATAEREIKTFVKLEHTNIVTYYNKVMDKEKKFIYLGLGYCEGTLKDILSAKSDFDELCKKPEK